MNTNNNLIHYLNSGIIVKFDYNNTHYPLVISNSTRSVRGGLTLNTVIEESFSVYLYPLSCLTETIIHEGKEEIPLVELAKIEGIIAYDTINYVIEGNRLNYDDIRFYFSGSSFLIYDIIKKHFYSTSNQLYLFQYLFSRRINIFSDSINSIDPRTLGDKNPYLINKTK